MKLCDLTEARYMTNHFLVVWADEGYWAKRGFTGATKAPVGEYQVTGNTHEMFRPDWERFRKNDAGWIIVKPSLKEIEQIAIDLDVHLDDASSSRDKFGQMIGRHKDFERLDDPFHMPDRVYEARIIPKRKWTLDDFAVGDRIVLTSHMRDGSEKRAAEVVNINHEKGWVNYKGDFRSGWLPAGQGMFYPTEIGRSRFGLVDVEIFKKSPRRNRQFNEARTHSHPINKIMQWIDKELNAPMLEKRFPGKTYKHNYDIEPSQVEAIKDALYSKYGEPELEDGKGVNGESVKRWGWTFTFGNDDFMRVIFLCTFQEPKVQIYYQQLSSERSPGVF